MSATFCVECGNHLSKRVKNPHNSKDEFCSQECAKLERTRYLETGPKNFLLYGEGNAALLGVFHSWEALLRGASYQTDIHKSMKEPLGKLFYELWIADYPQGAKEWDYLPEVQVTSFRKK